MNSFSVVRPNLLTHHALGMPIACMFAATQCLKACVHKSKLNPTKIINGLATAALATLGVLFACSTSEILVGSFAVASQATLFPWFLATVTVINLAHYMARPDRAENKIGLASILVIGAMAAFFNGLD